MPSFSGPWSIEDKEQVQNLLVPVLQDYPGVKITCYCRLTRGVPYRADVHYRGRIFGPVAYGPDILVENIKNCLPILY